MDMRQFDREQVRRARETYLDEAAESVVRMDIPFRIKLSERMANAKFGVLTDILHMCDDMAAEGGWKLSEVYSTVNPIKEIVMDRISERVFREALKVRE